ncbi:glycoside hydrolase family 16 protein [Karstenula rhodostoma CBS 690.94]|uniref:Glycoside hydrolase family 16 protein n=1 Tax=Karstenula rhodostoma CBS 690.94 TaxID=1392251 RepID=A0A9P4PHR2_9PLEO|nr:glycoside hydrolase family 16 protein [Karstenula rhodostoma CBS 690.94]
MQATPGIGMIINLVSMSDDLDEIDWEWSGNNFRDVNSQGKVAADVSFWCGNDTEPTSNERTPNPVIIILRCTYAAAFFRVINDEVYEHGINDSKEMVLSWSFERPCRRSFFCTLSTSRIKTKLRPLHQRTASRYQFKAALGPKGYELPASSRNSLFITNCDR